MFVFVDGVTISTLIRFDMNFRDFISRTDRTHDQLAQQLGCSRATITSIAIGRRKPSLSLCRRILIASGGQVTADELIAEFGSD